MNLYLKKFVEEKFKKQGKALDLGAGDFFNVACLRQLGWKCEGVDKNMGVNLEKPYESKNKPFDLVYSNYVLHKLTNKEQLVRTAYNNLKDGGWFFLHTFDKTDLNSNSGLSEDYVRNLLTKQEFKNVKTSVFDYYDNEHGHWHRILEVTGYKVKN